jgi:hypothetical protein
MWFEQLSHLRIKFVRLCYGVLCNSEQFKCQSHKNMWYTYFVFFCLYIYYCFVKKDLWQLGLQSRFYGFSNAQCYSGSLLTCNLTLGVCVCPNGFYWNDTSIACCEYQLFWYNIACSSLNHFIFKYSSTPSWIRCSVHPVDWLRDGQLLNEILLVHVKKKMELRQ